MHARHRVDKVVQIPDRCELATPGLADLLQPGDVQLGKDDLPIVKKRLVPADPAGHLRADRPGRVTDAYSERSNTVLLESNPSGLGGASLVIFSVGKQEDDLGGLLG